MPDKPIHRTSEENRPDYSTTGQRRTVTPEVRRFLQAVNAIRNGSTAEALREYRILLEMSLEEKEEIIFRTEREYLDEKKAFIEYNNERVREQFVGRRPNSFLFLLPFCIQHSSCPHRISWDITNCRLCGKCAVKDVREMCDAAGIDVKVSVRAIFATWFVWEIKPELTLAVACPDELLSGILRAAPLACYAIVNEQPEGYCFNTTVDVDEVKRSIEYFTNSRQRPAIAEDSSIENEMTCEKILAPPAEKTGSWTHYLLHMRPCSWGVVSAHLLVGFFLAMSGQLREAGVGMWARLAACAAVWTLLLNGGTLALNTAYDKDEGDIGYLSNPPPIPRRLVPFSLVLMTAGLVASAFLGWRLFTAYAVSFVASLLYCVPPVRLKAVPGFDLLINCTGYGALTAYAGYAAMGRSLSVESLLVFIGFFYEVDGQDFGQTIPYVSIRSIKPYP